MPSNRTPEITKQDGVTVIALGPDYENLDETFLDELKDCLLGVAESADPPLIILDLSHTKFFGSSFIEVLFRTWNRLNSREGGKLAICGLTPYCKEVVEVTHLNRLWQIFDTKEEAIQSVNESS